MAHKKSKDETDFDRWLAARLKAMRKDCSIEQADVSSLSGYSLPQIIRFENVSSPTSLPVYVLQAYCRLCDSTVNKLINDWIFGQPQPETKAISIGRLTDHEKKLISKLRSMRKIALTPAAEIVSTFTKADLETLYCLHEIGSVDPELRETIAREIFLIFKRFVVDDGTVTRTLTMDRLRRRNRKPKT